MGVSAKGTWGPEDCLSCKALCQTDLWTQRSIHGLAQILCRVFWYWVLFGLTWVALPQCIRCGHLVPATRLGLLSPVPWRRCQAVWQMPYGHPWIYLNILLLPMDTHGNQRCLPSFGAGIGARRLLTRRLFPGLRGEDNRLG